MKKNKIYHGIFRYMMLLTFSFFLISCAVRKSPPVKDPLPLEDVAVRNGQIHFMAHCHKCHPAGESGLGPAINSNPAPKFIKKFQVRHGLGVMPSFKDDEISDEELGEIMAYLKALRRN